MPQFSKALREELRAAVNKYLEDQKAIHAWMNSGGKHEGEEWEEIKRRKIKFVNPLI